MITCSGDYGSGAVAAAWTWGRTGAAEKAKRRRADLEGEAERAVEVKRRRDPWVEGAVDYLNTPRRRRRDGQEGQQR
jgi:Flp pilus assembly protein TadB